MKRAGFVVVVAAGLLAGCASIVHPGGVPNQAAWQARETRLARLDHWHLEGRIGVTTPQRGGSASFDWQQNGMRMTLLFSGPFGLGAVKLWGTANEMHVKDAKGHTWVSYAPRQALESTLGWPLPVGSLRYWVLGLPAPGADHALRIGSHGLLRGLQQQGWSVHYEAYLRQAGLLLPQRLLITRGATRIKLLVSQWTLETGP
ncbi:MAG: lipoprotein insertase outer membrane protein LolB [Gammaproteobacteria bacterium]